MGQEALDVFTRFCTLLGFQLKGEKSQVGPAIVFLDPLGIPPCQANDWKLSIALPGEKRAKWPALLSAYLKEGDFPPMHGGTDRAPFLLANIHFRQVCPNEITPDASEIPSQVFLRYSLPLRKIGFPLAEGSY